jgi:SAM-dependent methyltransferase
MNERRKLVDLFLRSYPFVESFHDHIQVQCLLDYYNIITKHVPAQGAVLDIGCGSCDKTFFFSQAGYDCTAVDDLKDPWHHSAENKEKIIKFAEDSRINFLHQDFFNLDFEQSRCELVMLNDVIEHLHLSPKVLLEKAVSSLKVGGFLVICVPNAANVRKRCSLMVGETNYPRFSEFYNSGREWRGHVREYVSGDLIELCEYLNLEKVALLGFDQMLHKLPRLTRPLYLMFSRPFPFLKDSLLLIGRKKCIP